MTAKHLALPVHFGAQNVFRLLTALRKRKVTGTKTCHGFHTKVLFGMKKVVEFSLFFLTLSKKQFNTSELGFFFFF